MASHMMEGDPSPARKQSVPGAFPLPDTPIVSSQQSLSQAVYQRRAEYTRSQKIRVKIGTWNVAALPGTEKDIGAWFIKGKGISDNLTGLTVRVEDDPSRNGNGNPVQSRVIESVTDQEKRRTKQMSTIPRNDSGSLPGGDDVDLYVLGLQEILDVNSKIEAIRPYTDPNPANKWKRSVSEALPEGYELVTEQQLLGLLILIYASPKIAHTISSVSTTSVGTGLGGWMGNKGAVTARIVLGETTRMVFVNCHLAAGNEKSSVSSRNEDAEQILSRTKFSPIQREGVVEEFGEGIGDEDFGFWFGDLNYRLDTLAGDDVRRLLMLHTRNEYDIRQTSLRKIDNELRAAGLSMDMPGSSNETAEGSETSSLSTASQALSITLHDVDESDHTTDPTSLQSTLSSLLPHDQLHKQMRSRKAFYDGWQEGAIDFLPTYKYDVGSVGMFDSSEKKRGPSWCDRILYRTRKDRLEYLRAMKEEEEARRKDAEMKGRGLDKPMDEEILYDYDPDTDGAEECYDENLEHDANSNIVVTKAGYGDRLELDYYTSHQRVLSSDHKPLDAVFTLDYDAVDLELKAAVHQEVARELDKAENEGRPCITLVVDSHTYDEGHPDESINFGDIRYNNPKIRSITIANTGRVAATFGFVDRHVGGFAPPWLSIKFDRASDNLNRNPNALREYTLEPGDTTGVNLTVQITDIEQVRSLNEGRSNIEDVLVLRVQNGRDHFLPLRGLWLQSSLGRSLEKLTRIPEGGVRRLQHQKPDGSSHSSGEDVVMWSAPKEVFQLTEAIEALVERTIAEWGMKETHRRPPWEPIGWPFSKVTWTSDLDQRNVLMDELREALDTGQAFVYPPEIDTAHKVEGLAATLLTFLESLEDGIVPQKLWQKLNKGIEERERFRKSVSGEEMRLWVLDILSVSPAHSISFTFLVSMLASVVNEIAPLRSLPPTPTTPRSPDTLLGRARGLSQDPTLARRQQINRKYAEVFVDVMIRGALPGKGREKKVEEDRRYRLLEVFLRSKWEEDWER
ncbi:hypothetical protein MMC17_009162 [Xylographa soralifera]|nr:hypothetical protein [Xylographa soralifera]